VRADGQTAEVVRQYTEDSMQAVQQRASLDDAPRRGSGLFRFQKIELLNGEGEAVKSLSIGETLRVRLHYDYDETHSFISMAVWLVIKHETRGPVTILSPNYVPGWDWNEQAPARVIEGAIEQVPWVPGNYFFDAYALFDNEHADHITSAAALIITYGDFYGKPIPVDTNTIYLTPQRWRAASDNHE
jgi:hypothetical protein